ncbi:sigma-70 family RNA polymerase sigma factor [Pseudooceanicola sp. C21-150M6]|uniref:sigma-70 family RNA polymerase sigma factor n=1 Tax=Pseudooceanicola sp. C21-150M6 TaxID=3434355 RepID=UPI003D7F8483
MTGFKDQLQACLPDLWRFAFALTRDRDAADDLVQDCLERALKKQHLRAPGRALRPWLMTMLRNIHRNDRRRPVLRGADLAEDIADPAGPDRAEDRLELSRLIDRVARLPEDQRVPLLFVVVGGMSYAETAEALDIPLGTVMSRIARARAALRSDPVPGRAVLRSVQ